MLIGDHGNLKQMPVQLATCYHIIRLYLQSFRSSQRSAIVLFMQRDRSVAVNFPNPDNAFPRTEPSQSAHITWT